MAHYSVDTSHGKVEFDSPRADLNQQEVQGIIDKYHPAGSINVPRPLQEAAKFITGPGRWGRGVGVGAQQLIQGKGPLDSAVRASAAMQPGYEAPPGERIGAFAGGLVDPINLGANAVLPGGSFLKSLASGAAMAGGSNILDQASQGKINTGEAGLVSGIGAGIGALTHGLAKLPSAFLRKAPAILESTSGTPERATELFKANKDIAKTHTGLEEEIKLKSESVMDAVSNQYDAAKAYFKTAAGKVRANLNAKEKALSKPIPPMQIPAAIDSMKTQVTNLAQPRVANPNIAISPARQAQMDAAKEQMSGNIFKRLLHIRQSIDHHVTYSGTGVPAVSTVQEGGLKELRKQVNQMIEQMPRGEILRDADKTMAGASEIFGKLQPKMKNTGDAIDFLKKTFEGKTEQSKEDMMNLLALEKATGHPVVNDLFKALTMSHFSQALAGNKISRSVAGISPFLMSAMLRVAGFPFQASLMASAAAVTLSRSPRAQGMAIRAAQEYGPAIAKSAGPTATGLLNLIRQREKD